jgi:hypothetical protein
MAAVPCPHATPYRRPLRIPSPGTGYVLRVELEASDGAVWSAIGGGDSIEGAIAFARESLPLDRHWRVVRLTDLYGV